MTTTPNAPDVAAVNVEGDDEEAIARAMGRLPIPEGLESAGLVLLLPDTSYPYHPSTGAVTDPAVVQALAARLRREADPDRLLVGVAGDGQVSDRRTAELLGYGPPDTDAANISGPEGADARGVGATRAVGDTEAPMPGVITREDCETTERTIWTHLGRVDVSVPTLLEAATVVTVPSLRVAPDVGLASASVTLGRWLRGNAPTVHEAAAGVAAIEPAATVVDGTAAYVGHPLATDVLLAGVSATTVDASVASLFGWSVNDVPYLSPEATAALIEGIDVDALRESLPRRPSDEPNEPNEAMATAYRAYARVTGDIVPPQFLPDNA